MRGSTKPTQGNRRECYARTRTTIFPTLRRDSMSRCALPDVLEGEGRPYHRPDSVRRHERHQVFPDPR